MRRTRAAPADGSISSGRTARRRGHVGPYVRPSKTCRHDTGTNDWNREAQREWRTSSTKK